MKTSLINNLTATRSLTALGILFLVLTISFIWLKPLAGGRLLDEVLTYSETVSALANMSADHRSAHLWITATIDTVYSLVYGLLLCGLTIRLDGAATGRLLPTLLAVIADFLENIIQILALTGSDTPSVPLAINDAECSSGGFNNMQGGLNA